MIKITVDLFIAVYTMIICMRALRGSHAMNTFIGVAFTSPHTHTMISIAWLFQADVT